MSTALATNPTRSAPSLSRSVCAVLGAVARGAASDRFVLIRRAAGSAHGASSIRIRAPEVSPRWLPPSVLEILEDSPSPWRVALGTVLDGQSLAVASVSALAVDVALPLRYLNPRDPSRTTGRQWRFDPRQVAEVLARLEAFTVPPTLIVKALPRIVAVWSLEAPSDVARAREVAEALSTALGGETLAKEWPAACSIPLPGTKSGGDHPGLVASCELLEDRRYTLEELAASTAPPKKRKRS